MKNLNIRFFVLFLAVAMVGSSPAWAVSREIVELQTQVQNLQTQLTQIQQSLDERMGVFRHLMDQNTDSINKVTTAITGMQTALQKEQSDSSNRGKLRSSFCVMTQAEIRFMAGLWLAAQYLTVYSGEPSLPPG